MEKRKVFKLITTMLTMSIITSLKRPKSQLWPFLARCSKEADQHANVPKNVNMLKMESKEESLNVQSHTCPGSTSTCSSSSLADSISEALVVQVEESQEKSQKN